MGYKDRCVEVGNRRRGGFVWQCPLLGLSALFGSFCLSYPVMCYYDISILWGNSPSPMQCIGLAVIWGLASSLSVADLRRFMNLFRIFGGHQEWVVGLSVDAFFDMLGKIQNQNESKLLSKVGFMFIGFLVTHINLNFIHDGTGLTNGAIVACVKALTGYYFVESAKTDSLQWILCLLLIMTCLMCKFTEGPSHQDDERGSNTSSREGSARPRSRISTSESHDA